MLRRRRLTLSLVAVCCLVGLLAARIYQVNLDMLGYPEDIHGVGETVELKGAFAEYAHEDTDGYKVIVNSARLMSRNEYVAQYAAEQANPVANPQDKTDWSAPTLAVFDLTIRNEKSLADERGYLDSIGWDVVPEREKHRWLRIDEVFRLSVPQIEGASQLSIKPGTEYVLHVPFSSLTGSAFPAPMGDFYASELSPGYYSLILTNVPIRHVVRAELKANAQ